MEVLLKKVLQQFLFRLLNGSGMKAYVCLLIYDFISNFPFSRGLKATASKGIYFGRFVKKMAIFYNLDICGGCEKIFKITLNHFNMQIYLYFPLFFFFIQITMIGRMMGRI